MNSALAEEAKAPGSAPAAQSGATAPAVTADKAAPGPDAPVEAAGEEKKDEKWWSIYFEYNFSHNIAKERPSLSTSLAIEPKFVVPDVGIGFKLHFGGALDHDYEGPDLGDRDVKRTYVDFDPILLTIDRPFKIDPKKTGFAINPSLRLGCPQTSEKAGRVPGALFSISPGVALSLSKWGLTLSNANSFQKNFHKSAYYEVNASDDGSGRRIPLSEWNYTNTTTLNYTVWKLSFTGLFSWRRSWRYNTEVQEQYINHVTYQFDVGIDMYEGFALNVGLLNFMAKERRYGGFGDDWALPVDPLTNYAYFTLSYTL